MPEDFVNLSSLFGESVKEQFRLAVSFWLCLISFTIQVAMPSCNLNLFQTDYNFSTIFSKACNLLGFGCREVGKKLSLKKEGRKGRWVGEKYCVHGSGIRPRQDGLAADHCAICKQDRVFLDILRWLHNLQV